MDKKTAISVPHPALSKIVQEELFKRGYGWVDDGKKVIELPRGESYITSNCDCTSGDLHIQHGGLQWFKDNDYTILTVTEFFAMEEEKEVYPRKLMLRSVEVTATVSRVIILNKDDSEAVTVTWKELAEINALKPEATP